MPQHPDPTRGYPFTSGPAQGGPFKTAQGVLTSPNDLDLGMLEALGVAPNATTTTYPPTDFLGHAPSTGFPATTTTGIPPTDYLGYAPTSGLGPDVATDPSGYALPDLPFKNLGGPTSGPSLGGPLGAAPAPGSSDPAWFSQASGGVPSSQMGWDMQDAATRSAVFRPEGVTEWDPTDQGGRGLRFDPLGALSGTWDAAKSIASGIKGVFEEPSVWTGERPTVLEGRGVNAAQTRVRALGGSASEAERYMSDLQAQGDDESARQFAEMYAEDTGVDLFDPSYDPSSPMYDDAGEMTPAASYGEMSPADRDQFNTWYNNPAVQEHYGNRALQGRADPGVFKDFAAVQHFVKSLPSAAEVEAQAVKDVTQTEVNAYLKELDAMSDEDYNQIAKNIGLSPMWYRGGDPGAADKKFLEEGNIRAHETGSFAEIPDFVDPADRKFLDPDNLRARESGSGLTIDNDAILAAVAADKAAKEKAAAVDDDITTDGDDGAVKVDVDAEIIEIFGGLVTEPQHAAIRTRMAELGTTDLTQAIRNEFATITTPDYSADILQRYDEMGTALGDAAAERSRVLEEATTRAEGRIGDIKTGLKSELESFETGRVEQQTVIERGVIDRTTKMETDLVDRLDDIRIALGDQVTSEFEEVAALAGTLTSSQATSSRDAISRLTQIGNMAAAARLSAPAELSAEALTALSDLEFKVENEISQGLADSQAQVKMQKASALLQETMRRGSFETEKQRALVESVLGETLRGTVYEDRTKEMLAQALMQEDQYVRQFNEGVDQQLAGAQLQNLFGTQDYERELDMMNLTRDWQTADTLQGRGWQTDDLTTTRGWQTDDYTKALADQRANALTERGWQQADVAAELGRQQAAALAAQPDMTKVLNRMRAEFPDVPDQLYSIAMHVKDMDHNPPMAEAKVEGPDWEPPQGFRGKYEPIGGANPGWLVTEQVGDSQAEVYLKTLTEGSVLAYDEITGRTQRTPALSAEDAGTLRSMVDLAISLDTQSDFYQQVANMSKEELQMLILQQGSGDSTPWDPTGGSNVGVLPTSATNAAGEGGSNWDTIQNMLTAGQYISGPSGWASLVAGEVGGQIRSKLPWG